MRGEIGLKCSGSSQHQQMVVDSLFCLVGDRPLVFLPHFYEKCMYDMYASMVQFILKVSLSIKVGIAGQAFGWKTCLFCPNIESTGMERLSSKS